MSPGAASTEQQPRDRSGSHRGGKRVVTNPIEYTVRGSVPARGPVSPVVIPVALPVPSTGDAAGKLLHPAHGRVTDVFGGTRGDVARAKTLLNRVDRFSHVGSCLIDFVAKLGRTRIRGVVSRFAGGRSEVGVGAGGE